MYVCMYVRHQPPQADDDDEEACALHVPLAHITAVARAAGGTAIKLQTRTHHVLFFPSEGMTHHVYSHIERYSRHIHTWSLLAVVVTSSFSSASSLLLYIIDFFSLSPNHSLRFLMLCLFLLVHCCIAGPGEQPYDNMHTIFMGFGSCVRTVLLPVRRQCDAATCL